MIDSHSPPDSHEHEPTLDEAHMNEIKRAIIGSRVWICGTFVVMATPLLFMLMVAALIILSTDSSAQQTLLELLRSPLNTGGMAGASTLPCANLYDYRRRNLLWFEALILANRDKKEFDEKLLGIIKQARKETVIREVLRHVFRIDSE